MSAPPRPSESSELPSRSVIVDRFGGRSPTEFGMFLPGVITHGRRGVALTFDACGGPGGSGYDKALIRTLRASGVPATLFLNARWIEANPGLAAELAADPGFELANHGWRHRPLTVDGRAAYGIAGTRSVAQAYDEVVRGMEAVAALSGQPPRWFRSGTAHLDDVGLAVANALGVDVVNFSVNLDFGGTAATATVAANLTSARRRDIVLGHFNQPGGHTAEGLAAALPGLLDAGTRFTTLSGALADA